MSHAEPYLQTYWDWRAAGNFILGGTGSGLLVFATLAVSYDANPASIVLASLVGIGAGLGLVWHELGRRLRAMNVFRQPQMSWMTRESYAAVLTFLLGLAAAWTQDRTLVVMAGLAALLFLYCQGRMLRASKGIPVWRETRVSPLIVVTGLAEGAAALVLVSAILHNAGLIAREPYIEIHKAAAAYALSLLLLLRAIAWAIYYRRIKLNAPIAAVRVLSRLQPYFLGLGHGLPLVCLAVGFGRGFATEWSAVFAALLAIAGGWLFKFSLVTRASYTQGFAIPRRPARGPRGSSGKGAKPGWTVRNGKGD
ncbi:MAG: phenylacetyl-CoA:acceptor oxidoreductase [Alphaproteobacteria bacterium]